jgi:hypothetical protein
MIAICPQCNKKCKHTFIGMQKLPERKDGRLWRDDNNNVVYNEVELWTCENCGSTWVKS